MVPLTFDFGLKSVPRIHTHAVRKDRLMANIDAVLEQLRSERQRTAQELGRLDQAISALDYSGRRRAGRRTAAGRRGRRPRRRLSAAARARIAAAQRARWAKLKQKQQARQSRKGPQRQEAKAA